VLENMKLGASKQSGERIWAGILPFLWRKQETDIEAKARELLARFKLDAKEKDFAASLSGGQRKLLEMARALMSDPVLVMLDEPMAGVNPALTQSLLDHILDLKDLGMTVVFVEHDMHMVRHIADWVVVMAEGKVVAEGPPDAVMKEQAVIDAYLGAHQDVDLGVVTGRHAGTLTAEGQELLEAAQELEQAVEAEVHRDADKPEDGR
jgi:branched-chain amino acid transport system ATP-binding protein